MTTVQIIAIAVASLAVLLLIIALIVTRRRPETPDGDDAQPTGSSFLDEAPQDTFAGLGKAEQPVEDITVDPAVQREAAELTSRERPPQPAGFGLDWEPDLSVRSTTHSPAPESPAPAVDDGTEITGELAAAEAAPLLSETVPPASEGESGGRLVPLTDIIVTTSGKMVDLEDPEVRRMLTDLVTFEIDQAEDFRRRGQKIDAVLQLTEAEKVSRALGMTESAQRIREMMEEIRRAE